MDIRELARRTGVSVATVSRALNNRPDVNPETRDRIVAMARELGYRPNHQARSLVRRRSGLLGLIWDTGYAAAGARHPFLADVLIGLKIAVASSHYHLMLVSPRDPDDVRAYVDAATQHGLEGLVLMGVDERSDPVTSLIATGRPCVAVDLELTGPFATYVTSDNRAGAASAVGHLHALGHRRIATVTGPLHMVPARERLAGYREACAGVGLPERPEYVEHGDFFLDGGYAATRRLLGLPEPPTAIFVAGDEMAVGALHAAADLGVRVPDQVSVVGFDDIEIAALVRPALSTVAQDRMALAASAVAALTDLVAARDAATARKIVVAGAGEIAGGMDPAPEPIVAGAHRTTDVAETPADDPGEGPGEGADDEFADGRSPAPRLLPTRLVVRDSCGPAPSR
jgi:LacI family transcriptional regulator